MGWIKICASGTKVKYEIFGMDIKDHEGRQIELSYSDFVNIIYSVPEKIKKKWPWIPKGGKIE